MLTNDNQCAIKEHGTGCLKPNNHLHGATCRNCEREVGNKSISDEDKSSKTVNDKSNLSTRENHQTSIDAHCNFHIYLECTIASRTEEPVKEKRRNCASKVERKSIRGNSSAKKEHCLIITFYCSIA